MIPGCVKDKTERKIGNLKCSNKIDLASSTFLIIVIGFLGLLWALRTAVLK